MEGNDIGFATQEYIFNVRCKNKLIELKTNKVYDYQVINDSLIIYNESKPICVEVLDKLSETIHKLKEYEKKSLLRLDMSNLKTGIYTFNLLCFYNHIHFEDKYQIVLDDAIYPELRRRKINSEKTVNFLMKELVFDEKYWFVYGNNNKNNQQCLCGKNIIITVAPSAQGYLHVLEIKKYKKRTNNITTLMSGKIEFKDNTKDLHRITKEFLNKYKQATRNNAELIELWKIYDKLDQECIKEDAEDMGFLKYKSYHRNRGNLIFNIEGGYVLSEFLRSDMQYAILSVEDFDKNEPLDYNPRDAIMIGSEFDKKCANTTEFIISEEYVDSFKKIPNKGYIVPSINGSIIQSKRRKIAQNRILNGQNPLLGLNLLIQSGDIVGVIGKNRTAITDELKKYIFGNDKSKDFNDRQKEAIGIAINTPDIAVIQGPPGTGKTQVIKAIVERINQLDNGESRILITSTQHDAVDNAIKGITYNGIPVNRVFNRERTNVEDAPIFGWIDEMISSCENWLKNNSTYTQNYDIFSCLASLAKSDYSEIESNLKNLYFLLQKDGYPAEILTMVSNTIVDLINFIEPSFNNNVNTLLCELIANQRTDKNSFLNDGVEQLKTFERYLKYDCENIDFQIPSYWKELKRIKEDTPRLDDLILIFKTDVDKLKNDYGSSSKNNQSSEKLNLMITQLINAVSTEITTRENDMTNKHKLYNQIWAFKHELSNIQNVRELISDYSQINAATCQQSANKFINPAMNGFDDKYDYVIIDEAARSNPLDLLVPMSMGKKIILVGDHKQLPHLVEKDIIDLVVAEKKDNTVAQVLEESLFMRLFNNVREADTKARLDPNKPIQINRTCILNEQFRMHSQICELINVFYKDEQLKTACADSDKQHNLNLYNNKPLVWLDVPACENYPYESKDISKSRPCEVDIAKKELSKILIANSDFNVGIITFYSKQAELFKRMVDDEFISDAYRISVGTVDAFQGKEFDIVILSAVRSNTEIDIKKRVGFLNNNNRLCVAFSRAKRLLITIGDSFTVANDGKTTIIEPLNELLKRSKQEDIGYYETL